MPPAGSVPSHGILRRAGPAPALRAVAPGDRRALRQARHRPSDEQSAAPLPWLVFDLLTGPDGGSDEFAFLIGLSARVGTAPELLP